MFSIVFRPASLRSASTAPDITSCVRYKYLAIVRSEVDMTTRQSDVAGNFLYIVRPPIYGFVIEKEFPATLFSARPPLRFPPLSRPCRRAL